MMNTNKPNQHKELIHVTAIAKPLAKGVVRTWGNSLAVRIPLEVSKMAKLDNGVEIGFHVSDDGEIVLRPKLYPESDDQDGLRALYLSLISKPMPESAESYEDIFDDGPVGDEMI